MIRNYHGHLSGVYSIALHPALPLLITGGRDSAVRVWDIRTRHQVHCMSGHQSTVASLLTHAADPQVISGSHDKQIRLWDIRTGNTLHTLTYHKKSVRALAMSDQTVLPLCAAFCASALAGPLMAYLRTAHTSALSAWLH